MTEIQIESLQLEEQREKMCTGKEPYPSESAALAAIKVLRKSGLLRKPHQLTPYKCKFADHYHFGH